MDQEQIEDYVRKVLEFYWIQDRYFVDSAVIQISHKWTEAQAKVHQEAVLIGQESCGDWQD